MSRGTSKEADGPTYYCVATSISLGSFFLSMLLFVHAGFPTYQRIYRNAARNFSRRDAVWGVHDGYVAREAVLRLSRDALLASVDVELVGCRSLVNTVISVIM
jgi:hypothetical protein